MPNRDHLFEQIGRLTKNAHSRGGALLVIDLDHFKRINDLQGHAAGDELLVHIARRLQGQLGPSDSLARLSGGVFAWLVACGGTEDVNCAEDEASALRALTDAACDLEIVCASVAERIRQALAQPFAQPKGLDVGVTASIGWCGFVPGQESPEEIFKRAELAMYAAKADAGAADSGRFLAQL